MSVLIHTRFGASHQTAAGAPIMHAIAGMARAVLGWPSRVHANRKLLNQMAGMSAYELADIGLSAADLHDTAALSLDTDVGRFLSGRAAARRRTWNDRRS